MKWEARQTAVLLTISPGSGKVLLSRRHLHAKVEPWPHAGRMPEKMKQELYFCAEGKLG